MNRSEVTRLLGSDWTKVQDLIRESLGSDVQLLHDINTGLLSNAGKMLRPMLTLYIARACGGGTVSDESIRGAAAMEILHNATLLHDDVADAAPTRRGKPTVLSRYGAVPAVLVGDFWLSRAVSLLVDSSHLRWTVAVCAKTLTDLAEGEMLQQQKAFSSDTTVDDYLRIIYCKTASLFETACKIGAVSVGADDDMVKAAGEYGKALGMAFQIQDDILDYTGSDATGKPVGIDILEQKITLPLLGALARSGDDGSVRRMIHDIPGHAEYAGMLRDFVTQNKGVEYARDMLESYVEEAVAALGAFAPSSDREVLGFIAMQSSNRDR